MAALKYAPVCLCGNSLKVFVSSGKTAKRCSDCGGAGRKAKQKPLRVCWLRRCVDCGVTIAARSARCKACHLRFFAKTQATCAGCGVVFMPKSKRHSKYCSRECAWRHKVGENHPQHLNKPAPFSRVYFNTCKQCGKMWTGRTRRTTCSSECAREYARVDAMRRYTAQHALEVASREPIPCVRCGSLFIPNHGRVACSKACAQRIQKDNGQNNYRKKARFYGVAYEPINRQRVFARDGWRCQICGKDTPRARQGTTRSNAPELDHRVPMSKGGPHLYSNVQCTCRACNGEKSNRRETGQLPLFNHEVTGAG